MNACTNKVGPIVTLNHPNIPACTDQSFDQSHVASMYTALQDKPANVAPYLF